MALAVVALYLVSVEGLNMLVNGNLVGFLFFGTIVCYNFVKYGVEADKYLIVAKPSHRSIQIFSFLAFGASLFFLLRLDRSLWGYIMALTVLSTLYAVPFLPKSKNLRSLGGLKIFLVALVWTGFTLLFPILDAGLALGADVLIQLLQRFVLVLVLILPFEIRDLQYDPPELKTLPQLLGVSNTKKLGYALVGLYVLLEFSLGARVVLIIYTGMTAIMLLMAVYSAGKQQLPYFASFWVEAIPIFMFLLIKGLGWIA